MKQENSLEDSYLAFIEFLMVAKRRIIELGGEYDLTGMQTMMLFLLDEPRPMNSFKKIFNCDASNVTGLVDGLEQKHLACRSENPDDRRIKMVQLESRGREVRTALLHRLAEHENPLMSSLSPDEFQTFITLLKKINAGA